MFLTYISEIFCILCGDYCGLCSVAGKMASISEENNGISDFEGFTEKDLADNISVVSLG